MFVGGVRSGKTNLAGEWLEARAENPVYVATCDPRDPETMARVVRHRESRGERWRTLESRLNLSSDLESFIDSERLRGAGVLIDCMSMWLANALEADLSREKIFSALSGLFGLIENLRLPAALVSAECGLGFAPMNALARRYGDLLGEINQYCAARCASVYFVSCGLLLPLK